MDQISFSDYSNLCRLCGSKVNVLEGLRIFEEGGELKQLYKKIVECLPIHVRSEDKLPKMVCEECAFKLDEFCDFRDKSLKTEYALNEMLKSTFVSSDDISMAIESYFYDTNQEAIKVPSVQGAQVSQMAENLGNIAVPMPEPNSSNKPRSNLVRTSFSQAHPDYDSSLDSDCLENSPRETAMIPNSNLSQSLTSTSDKRVLTKNLLVARDWSDCCEGCGKPGVNSGQCNDCSQDTAEEINADGHTGKTCPDCGKVYRSNYKLAQHMWCHSGEKPLKCSACDKTFRSKIGLTQHEAKHTGQYEFNCSICGKGFQCKSYLMVHQRVHSDDRPYPCETCGASFKSKQSLLDHMNRHLGLKPYLCEVCGRGFITKGLCKSHQKVHSGTDNRQYPCTVCNKLFVSKSYLATHLRIHTGEKPYTCEVCSKGFLTRVDLRIHSTVHTGEKSFVCEMCGKAFARRDALRCHRRSHTGERPYRCDICGQSFTQFSPMAIHKRLHTGERPYACDLCARTFVSKSTLMCHRKKHLVQIPRTPCLEETTPSTSTNSIDEDITQIPLTEVYVVAADEATGYTSTITLVQSTLPGSERIISLPENLI